MNLKELIFGKKEVRSTPKKKTVIWDDKPSYSYTVPPQWSKTKYFDAICESWTYACMNVIADAVASINFHLYKSTSKGELEELFDHELLDLLNKVNSQTSKHDHLWTTTAYLEASGEAPWLLDIVNGKPQSIYLLRPDRLTINFSKESDKLIDSYAYEKSNLEKVPIEPEELIFLKYPNPKNLFRGYGTLEAIKRTFDIDEFSEEWNKMFFYNSARPDTVFKMPDGITLTDDQIKRMKADIRNNYSGQENARKFMLLEGGVDIKEFGRSQKDMDFDKQLKFVRDKILAVFRVPKSILGITEDVNRANAEASYYVFAKYCIKPKMQKIVEQLNEFLVPMYGDDLILDFEDPVPEDQESRLKKYENALYFGWMTVDEVRTMEGLEAMDAENEKKVSSNVIQFHEKRKQRRNELKDKIKPLVKKELVLGNNKRRLKMWQEWLDRVFKYEKQLKELSQEMFKEEEKEVLEGLGKKKKMFSEDKYTKKYGPMFGDLMVKLAKDESEELINSHNLPAGKIGVKDIQQEFIRKRGMELVTGINKTTKDNLKKQFTISVEKNESVDQLKRRVKKVFKDANTYRARMIGRTESSFLANYTAEQQYIESGVVIQKEWLVDGYPCAQCASLDGERTELNGVFAGQHENPPIHPNCMCTIIPVVELKSKQVFKKDHAENLIKEAEKELLSLNK